jgi:hypothetical protein
MSKKSKKARLNKQAAVRPQQNKVSSVTGSSVVNKPTSVASPVITSVTRGMTAVKHQHIIPDLIRIAIIAGIIFVIEIVLGFIIH